MDVVTSLKVDSSSAVESLRNFEAAMNKAADASQKAVATMTQGPNSISGIAKNWEKAQANGDAVFAATVRRQREVEKAFQAANAAVAAGLATHDQAVRTVAAVAAKYDALTASAAKAATTQTVFGKAMSGVQGQLVALAAGAGPVGVFLAGLGPWGMAGAAGLGLLAAAFGEAKRTAEALAKEADVLTNQAEVTGFSTDALQALSIEAAKHGVSMEQASAAVVKFTTAWAEARDGGGAMLTQLRAIDPALASQIQRTKDGTVAFDLLAQAINKANAAGDIATRNALLRAAGGRGGVQAFAGLSQVVGDAGGLANLTRQATEAGNIIGGKLLQEIDNLKDELDETKKRADMLFGSIGAKPILESELAWQKVRLQVSGMLADMENGKSTMDKWSQFLFRLSNTVMGPDTTAKLFGLGDGLGQPALNQKPAYPPKLNTTGLEPPAAALPPKDIKAQLADLREQVALLGSAATANDRLKLRMLELKSAVEANNTAENQLAATRGMSAAQLDAYIEKINLHNAALGASASTSDIVAARMAALQKMQMQGAGLTESELENQKRIATEQVNGTASILQQADSYKISAATQGMAAGAAAALSAKLQLLAQDIRAGKVATEEDNKAREEAIRLLGTQAQAATKAQIGSQIKFDRDTALLSQEDVQIAQQLRALYSDVTVALNSNEASAIRMNSSIKTAKEAAKSASPNQTYCPERTATREFSYSATAA